MLGPLRVWGRDGVEVVVGGPRVRALVAVLVVDAGRVVGVPRLVEALYGGAAPGGAVNAVQSLVSRARAAGVVVERSSGGYRVPVGRDAVDALRFEDLVARGRVGEALALWRGVPLSDVGDAPFAGVVAARWEELRLRAVEEHEGVVSVGVLRELVAAHPLRERLAARLVWALRGEGRDAEALGVFASARRVLAEELGVGPSAVLVEAHGAVVRGGGVRRVLPAQLTSFVGRSVELAAVAAALGGSRLVTLTGAGGVGKTRLAVEAVSRVPGEVVFVDLAPVAVGGDVVGAVGAALGLREDGPGSGVSVARLVVALSGRAVVLVLDNCEHVVDDVAVVAGRLLSACAGLRMVATSREVLGLTGEVVVPVPPLDPGSAAVRLFADRAAAVCPGFRVDAVTGPSVVAICVALEGLPLAVELAAARVRSLPVAEVAARLGDRFGLLSRGSRAVVERHRTLEAVVGWSWGLLSERERVVARRLTVFVDGASLVGAVAVCGGDAAEVVPSLVDKSLVEVVGGRYRMSETVRVFCAARLEESGEGGVVRAGLVSYLTGLVGGAATGLLRAGQVEWLGVVGAEHGNLRAAVRWAASAEVGSALRLMAVAGWYFWLRGSRSEGAALAAEVVAAAGVAPEGLAEEFLLCELNAGAHGVGGAGGVAARRLVPEEFPGPPVYPFLTLLWGMAYGVPEVSPEDGAGVLDRLVGGDPWSVALARVGAGMRFQYAGAVVEATRELEVGLAGFRALGERWGTSLALTQLAEASAVRGGLVEAVGLVDEALSVVAAFGDTEHVAGMWCRRAEWSRLSGDLDGAWADLERAVVVARGQGAAEAVAAARVGMAEVARLRGDLVGARAWAEEALAVCPVGWFAPEEVRAFARVALGRVALASGDVVGARREWVAAARSGAEWGNQVVVSRVAEAFAGLSVVVGDGVGAARLLGAGAALRGGVGGVDPDVVACSEAAVGLVGAGVFGVAFGEGRGWGRAEVVAAVGA
ncbi:BTAD domain-containing putative transcriptional regulator [Actinosynnema sp. NPDC020468]|uniref:ATP-binding protein n=1 Tax=Actinosynnema sp. NPDC020468 TaxID=3154488 RepID=UPI0033D8FFA8